MVKNLQNVTNAANNTLASEKAKNNDPYSRLSSIYYKEAADLEKYIGVLKMKIRSQPSPDELSSLEKRIEVLREERRDLLRAALQLSKLAAPPPVHPSLLHRESEAS